MSERDLNQDPIDKAYAEAEALLSDEQARAARRAKLLAAMAAQAAPAIEAPRRSPWPRGVWLTAAGIAGVALVVASQSHLADRFRVQAPPPAVQPPPTVAATAPLVAAPTSPPPMKQSPATAPTRSAPTPEATPAPPAIIPAEPKAFPESGAPAPAPAESSLNLRNLGSGRTAPRPDISPPVQQRDVPPPPEPGPPPPPPIVIKPQERMIVPPPPRRPAPPLVVAPPPPRPAVAPLAAAPSALSAETRDALSDRLRAAAADGRTPEVETLLTQGVVIDAPDEAGYTALMRAVRADHPDVAAALRRRGASLDVKNRAGESARDMAAAIGDAKLNQALGLTPTP